MNFPVRMKHPEHGFMHAYGQDELDRLVGYGWSVEEAEGVSVVEAPKKRSRKKAQA